MKKSIGGNTILHPHPVVLVATYDKDGKPNMMTAAWAGICCSKPPCVGVSLREATKTYHSIMHSKAFTVNIPSRDFVKQADYAGLVSGSKADKFKVTGLTPVKSEVVNAPYVKELPVALECMLKQSVQIGLHTQFIGEILNVLCDEEVLGPNGLPDIEKLKPLIYATGNMAYYSVGGFVQKAFTIKEYGK